MSGSMAQLTQGEHAKNILGMEVMHEKEFAYYIFSTPMDVSTETRQVSEGEG